MKQMRNYKEEEIEKQVNSGLIQHLTYPMAGHRPAGRRYHSQAD